MTEREQARLVIGAIFAVALLLRPRERVGAEPDSRPRDIAATAVAHADALLKELEA